MDLRSIPEIFVHTHFLLRKIHYWQGSVLANGVSFRRDEPNGRWFWWWNWRAFLCVALALAFVCVASLGTIKPQQYVSKDTLWVAGNAPILADKHHYESLFGSVDLARIVLTANQGYEQNLMHRELFTSLWRLHTYITDELVVTVNGKQYMFNDVCVIVTLLGETGCYQFNPLAFWPSGDGPGSFQRPSSNVGGVINDGQSLIFNPWTRVEDILGGIKRVDGKIVSIEALQIHYFFDSSQPRFAANPDWTKVLQSFEDALLATLKRYTFAQIAPNINLSYNKEIYSTMIADWPFLGASVCIILAILALGFLSMDFIHHSRILLGFMAALTIAFAITSTQGAASALFLSETVFDTYAIFLITIIGLNHLFILIHTYDRVIDKELMKPEPRVQKGAVSQAGQRGDAQATYRLYVTETLAEAMPSITAVYLIGIPVFGIGILSEYYFQYRPIPGLVSMSATCGFGLFILYVLLNLFFIPALALDALRVVENRTDVLCLKREPEEPTRYTPVIGDIEVTPEVSLPPPPPYERLCHILFRKAIAPVVTKLPIKIAVISLVILIVGLSIFMIADNKFALLPHPRQENLPSDNYLATYYGVQDQFFNKVGTAVSLVVTGADYTDENTYELDESECIRPGSIANWYSDYIQYLVSKGMNISNFYKPLDSSNNTNIANWLDTPKGGRYTKNLIFNKDGTVKAAAFAFNMIPLPARARQEYLDYAHMLQNLAQDDESIQKLSDERAFIYGKEFIYTEEPWMLTQAMIAKIVVYLVLFLLLGLLFLDARSVVLIVLSTASVASLIYGILMYFLNMNISVYSISCLVMLAMVSFDYHFQIAYFWMRDKGPRTARLMNVVAQIGTSLCCAYFAQFFGMMVLMFSLSSPINQSFAYLYVSITSFSFVLSVLVLPIILSWVGLRRQRIVIQRKHKGVLGGVMWDGQSDRDEEDDNYWSTDDEGSFYHDPDKHPLLSHDSDGSSGGGSDRYLKDDNGQVQLRSGFEEYEDRIVGEGQPGQGRTATQIRGLNGSGGGTTALSGGSMSRIAPTDTSSAEVVARSLAGGGHEVTLEQLFVMAEQAEQTPGPTALTSASDSAPATKERPRSTDTPQADEGDGGSGGGGGNTRTRTLTASTHHRTASGLRDLIFGTNSASSTVGSAGTVGSTASSGLHSFPSPSPTLANATTSSGRWSREGSWLTSSRGGSKYFE